MKLGRRLKTPAAAPAWAVAGALFAAAFARAAHPQPDDALIRRRLEEVFARPEFSPQVHPWQRLLELLARLFAWLGGLRGTSPVLFWLLLGGCILLLLLLGGHIAWTVSRIFIAPTRLGGGGEAAEERRRLSLAYREEARRKAEQGEFTEAIRFLFLSLVYWYDESGRVSFQRASTNREYLTLFADRPELQAELAVFVDTLDEYWYGQRPTDAERYQTCLALYEGLK